MSSIPQTLPQPMRMPARKRPAKAGVLPASDVQMDWRLVTLFLAFNIAIAVPMSNSEGLSQAHSFVTLGVGLWFAIRKRVDMVLCILGYTAGAEVLWRMTGGNFFWEWAKYSSVLLCLVTMVFTRQMKINVPATMYFLLLLPSISLTLSALPIEDARKEISFTLSGPFALAVCSWFFSNVKVDSKQLAKALIAVVAPAVSVAVIAIVGIATADRLRFTPDSNPLTSGGFGPNQVSSILGLGAYVGFIALLLVWRDPKLRLLMGVIVLLCTAQSAFTFSRGGLYGAVGAVGVASIFIFASPKLRSRLLVVSALILSLMTWVIFPRLNEFSKGALEKRFTDTDLTKRDTIVEKDIEMFLENPILGVGPGMARFTGYEEINQGASHTEFTRMISEHGLFGIVSFLCFLGIGSVAFFRCRSPLGRAVLAGNVIWSCLYMSNAAMRLVAPSFIFGLGMITIVGAQPALRSMLRRRNTPLHARGGQMIPAEGSAGPVQG